MIAIGFLLGTVVTGLLALGVVRALTRGRCKLHLQLEQAATDRATFGLNLLAAYDELDRLRRLLGQAPLPRPTLSDLSRTARSQEDPCSSTDQN